MEDILDSSRFYCGNLTSLVAKFLMSVPCLKFFFTEKVISDSVMCDVLRKHAHSPLVETRWHLLQFQVYGCTLTWWCYDDLQIVRTAVVAVVSLGIAFIPTKLFSCTRYCSASFQKCLTTFLFRSSKACCIIYCFSCTMFKSNERPLLLCFASQLVRYYLGPHVSATLTRLSSRLPQHKYYAWRY